MVSDIHSETTFSDINDKVEKADIDLFGNFFSNDRIKGDIYFIAPLQHINMPMIKGAWESTIKSDMLALPNPF